MTHGLDYPLSGISVVDLVRGPMASITRYLAELGARVDRIDEPGSAMDAVEALVANVGKQHHRIDLMSAAAQTLIDNAHIIVADSDQPIDLAALQRERPELVTMTVSDFGCNTAMTNWKGSGPVLHALSGELSRSGIRGREPLLPPGDLAYQCAASQAAYTLVTGLYRALKTGVGDHFDFSALDGAVQALDPGYGVNGSATMGKPANLLARARPAAGFQYPVLKCADGHVRLCLLAKRQWRGMFRWMGEPAAFASPEFDKMIVRYKSPELLPAIGAFFADMTREEIEAGGQKFGVPVSAILTFEESIDTDHVRDRNAITSLGTPDGRVAKVPNGMLCIDGLRTGLGAEGEAQAFRPPERSSDSGQPFEGLKVLDLGVIVVGAEQGRLLGDQGADVLKVESRAYPDGNRQSYLKYGMSVSFAAGHRNKRSLGINLRDPEGRKLFLELAAQADVILSNFKPGTMESLGLDYETVSAINPRIVMVDSSAFGATGPWSGRMGYGPLVRAATGLALAWRYPDDPEGFCDSVTIYPDHVAGRVGAMGAVALLIRRLRTGRGGTASVAQSEVMLSHFAADVARVSLGLPTGTPSDHPYGVYPAAGDDEWCVVVVDGDQSWRGFCEAIGFSAGEGLTTPAARLAAREGIDAALTAWLASRTPLEAATALQTHGVAAAPMLRLADLPDFAYYRDRNFYRTESHPYLPEDFLVERRHVTGRATVDAETRPAPLAGEHSSEVIAEWLGLPAETLSRLEETGVIEGVDPREWKAIEDTIAPSEQGRA
ncbi:CoA transferase [Tsuneonella flava]|uniref:CoA transferase n=1 Tax=Tsuneonella flava TaxID=2055955 RepID=A0ABX7KBB8_9SPHN|nr:CoA transferase [Tsuneonella flava]QSB44504.1 CoA transferase [Tsuneonella flava]